MRHGQTDWNRLGLCNDDPAAPVHLTGEGRRQAGGAAAALRDVALERIFVSELVRTRETAEIVGRHHGAPIEARPELNDIRSGFDGRPVQEYFAATGHDRLHARANGGESLLDYRARVLPFLEWLRAQPYREVLVVAHEETLRVLVTELEGLRLEAMPDLGFDNAALLRYEI